LIKLVIILQIMGKATLLALLVAGQASGQINLSQSMVLTVIVADTVVAVIGMALAVQVQRCLNTLDIEELSRLKG
jgi:NADH:ubiquinone oxidoreductase subunit K